MSGLYGWVAASGYVLLIGSVLLYFISTLLEPMRKTEKSKSEPAPQPEPDYKRIAELEAECAIPMAEVIRKAEMLGVLTFTFPDLTVVTDDQAVAAWVAECVRVGDPIYSRAG